MPKSVIIPLLLALALLLGFSVALPSAVITNWSRKDLRDVPLSHWANPVLDRFQAKGYLDLPATRPWTRDQVASVLAVFLGRYQNKEVSLSRGDLYDLKRLYQEFKPDIRRDIVRFSSPLSMNFEKPRLVKKDLLTYTSGTSMIASGDIAATGVSSVSKGAEPAYSGAFDIDMWGSMARSFVFDQKFTAVIEKENERDVRTAPNVMSWRGGKLLTDWSYFRFKMPWFTATLGRSRKWWGPGRFGTLLLSDNAPAFDALDLAFSYKRVGFHAFAGISPPSRSATSPVTA